MLRSAAIASLLALVCQTQPVPPDQTRELPVPASPYLGVVYRYADAMLASGRDTYGPQKTGLFLSALDRVTMAPLTARPASPAGIRRGDRDGPAWASLTGANPMHDENLLRVLYTLSDLSGKPAYREAADNELKWFFENAASPTTGLLPWGEHMSWNVILDEPIPKGDDAVHEYYRPWVLMDRCFELTPEASKRYCLAVWEHQIADHVNGGFDRHAAYWKHGPTVGMDFPRHAGFYIRTWATAYANTHDPAFLKAIEVLLSRHEKKRHPQSGLIEERSGRPAAAPLSTLSLAIDCGAAADRVPEPLAEQLRSFARREDQVFCGLPHDIPSRRGFITSVEKATGKVAEERTSVWDAGYGANTTAGVGMMCVARYENGGNIDYRDMIVAAADAYLKTLPGEDVDAWPMTSGHAISLELAAWRITAKPVYLNRAQQLADFAVARYWEDRPLPRASLKTGHYETITGADTLALALVELHLSILHITAVKCPSNTIDR